MLDDQMFKFVRVGQSVSLSEALAMDKQSPLAGLTEQ